MKLDINDVSLCGKVATNPVRRQGKPKKGAPGVVYCTFRLMVQRKKKGRGGEFQSDFIGVKAFDSVAERVLAYLDRGSPVHIKGRIAVDSWEQGVERVERVEVIAYEVQFMETKAEKEQRQAAAGKGYEAAVAEVPYFESPWDDDEQ